MLEELQEPVLLLAGAEDAAVPVGVLVAVPVGVLVAVPIAVLVGAMLLWLCTRTIASNRGKVNKTKCIMLHY
jgi:hypothetical protein